MQVRGYRTEAKATWLCQARCGQCVGGHGRAWLCGLGWAQVLWREAGRPAQLCDVLGSRTGGVRERCELYLDK